MPREWSLTVEEFGRIERAEVTVKPLTVLVGPNNSGKTYLGTLIWGIEHGGLSGGLSSPSHTRDRLEPVLRQWSARALGRDDSWVAWNREEQQAFREQWPAHVRETLPDLFLEAFGVEGLHATRLDVSAPGLDETWYMASAKRSPWGHRGQEPWILLSNRDTSPLGVELDTRSELLRAPSDLLEWGIPLDTPDVKAAIATNPIRYAYMAGYSFGTMSREYYESSAAFLPASRTGCSLFYPAFLQALLTNTLPSPRTRPSVESIAASIRLTSPQIHLMSGLINAFGGKRGPYADEADRLEQECLEGTVVVRAETGVARYVFRPDGATEDLGLQLSSALVTELMPLIVLLRYSQGLPFLVIEEPEAHLHPKLQRVVTRCLCRLVRRGVRVLVTTHSATIAQQVNNLIKLGKLDEDRRSELQRRFHYDEAEHLDEAEVSVHEFRFRDDGRSIVERIDSGSGGFPMPAFNEDLHLLVDETLALNAALDAEGDE